MLVRLDGLYGNAAPLMTVINAGLGVVGRSKDYSLLDREVVRAHLAQPPDLECVHPESGASRSLYDCPDLPLVEAEPRVRVVVATHAATSASPPVGVQRGSLVYELFVTTLPQGAFSPKDVLDLYLHRGSFETVLADEDIEQDPDRWCSHTPCGQEFWQIVNQWMWNLRLECGQQLSPTPVRTTEFAPATAPMPTPAPTPATTSPPAVEYGPPRWARLSFDFRFSRIGLSSPARWNASLPRSPSPLSSRASARARWVVSAIVCRTH